VSSPLAASARGTSGRATVTIVESEFVHWLMQPDPTGTELPDLADFIRRPEWFARPACRGSGTASHFPERARPLK
jgi:hypothetical protein